MDEIRTPRLMLRQWRGADLEPFAALNSDPEVMRYFPSPLTRGESDALAERERTMIAERGWGLWAVEVIDRASFIGFVGLARPLFQAHFTPAIEVGWRLARDDWGRGYATEAARAALAFGFDELGLDEIVSFTSVVNVRSQKVMKRIGMTHDPNDDFDHPNVVAGNPLRPHVLHRVSREAWGAEPAAYS
jgi:RimJ/RimL family protein N-acetyltransferase